MWSQYIAGVVLLSSANQALEGKASQAKAEPTWLSTLLLLRQVKLHILLITRCLTWACLAVKSSDIYKLEKARVATYLQNCKMLWNTAIDLWWQEVSIYALRHEFCVANIAAVDCLSQNYSQSYLNINRVLSYHFWSIPRSYPWMSLLPCLMLSLIKIYGQPIWAPWSQ